jgi:hypothetical protein
MSVSHRNAGVASTTTLQVTTIAKAAGMHSATLASTVSIPQALATGRLLLAATAVERIAMHRPVNHGTLRRGVDMTVHDLLRAAIGRKKTKDLRVSGGADGEGDQQG